MPIDSRIRDIINQYGYLTVDKMMKEVLSTNSTSYYRTQSFIGKDGDFTTSPEISQLFGEIIGLWCIDQWQKLGSPKQFILCELGPGSGVLMRDLLKVAKLSPEFYRALHLKLFDINDNLIELQKSNLSNFDLPIEWLSSIYDLDKLPSIIIANEFFDTLPIKQYIKVKELWHECIFVTTPNDSKIKFDKIGINKDLQLQLLQDHPNAYDGAVLEESLESLEFIRFISDHIKNFVGSCLIIDYGYDIDPIKRIRSEYNPTLQAIKNHKYHPLLETLGEADISAHVDFYSLKKTAHEQNIKVYNTISQRDFLINNGLLIRAAELKKILPQDKRDIIDRQIDRLISKSQMGELFKALVLQNID